MKSKVAVFKKAFLLSWLLLGFVIVQPFGTKAHAGDDGLYLRNSIQKIENLFKHGKANKESLRSDLFGLLYSTINNGYDDVIIFILSAHVMQYADELQNPDSEECTNGKAISEKYLPISLSENFDEGTFNWLKENLAESLNFFEGLETRKEVMQFAYSLAQDSPDYTFEDLIVALEAPANSKVMKLFSDFKVSLGISSDSEAELSVNNNSQWKSLSVQGPTGLSAFGGFESHSHTGASGPSTLYSGQLPQSTSSGLSSPSQPSFQHISEPSSSMAGVSAIDDLLFEGGEKISSTAPNDLIRKTKK